jgi:hypothetical protein
LIKNWISKIEEIYSNVCQKKQRDFEEIKAKRNLQDEQAGTLQY